MCLFLVSFEPNTNSSRTGSLSMAWFLACYRYSVITCWIFESSWGAKASGHNSCGAIVNNRPSKDQIRLLETTYISETFPLAPFVRIIPLIWVGKWNWDETKNDIAILRLKINHCEICILWVTLRLEHFLLALKYSLVSSKFPEMPKGHSSWEINPSMGTKHSSDK